MSVSTVLNRWLKRLYKLLAILLVAFAVLISTLRLFLPYAHNYRQDVEDYLNNSYNSNISIGSLSMGWSKTGPTLITQDLALLSSDASKIFIDSLEVEVDFWRSIRSGQWVTQDFVISGAELVFEQGSIESSAEQAGSDESNDNNLIDTISSILLEQISRFSIRDSHLLYYAATGVRAFTINELFWVNENERHRANGTVIVDGLSSNNLKVLLDFQGPKFHKLTGQAYLEANEIDITPWLGRVLAIKDSNTHSAINFNAWLTVDSGRPETLQLALGDNEITWQHHNKVQSFEIIGGDIEFKSIDEQVFDIATSALTIKRNGAQTNKVSLLANVNGNNINGYINALELASFEGISPLIFNDVGIVNLLLDLDAVGRVEDIHFRSGPNDLAVTANFDQITSHFSQGIPGIDNVSGDLVYSNKQLKITLNALDGALDFGQHFKYPIPYTQLSSVINATFSPSGWQLTAENLSFNSPQIQLNADLTVERLDEQPTTMALLATVNRGDAKYAEYFYPHLLMGNDLVNYLNSAIVSGNMNQALVLFNGPLERFPFNQNEGIFVVDAELSESTFKFDAQWPAIKNFAANLNFTNNSMLITGREGTLSGIDVVGVEAAIADLSEGQTLTVDASFAKTSAKDVFQLMNDSPMQDTVGATLAQVIVKKPINGEFSLILPLNNPDAVIAKGHVDFHNNTVALQAPRMDFNHVNGRLNYQNDEITVSGISLDWRGMPLTLNVLAKQKPEHYNVSIDTIAQWQEAQWQAQLPEDLIKYAQGELSWKGLLSLNITDEKFTYDYQINSTLSDINVALPAPFSKAADDNVNVNIHAYGNDIKSTINADIGDNIDFYGLLDHQQTRFSLAHLVLGKPQLWLPTEGFHITADVENANYAHWQPLVLDIITAVEAQAIDTAQIDASANSVLSAPNKVHGNITNLEVYGQSFQQVSFDFMPKANWWLLNVNAKELRASAKFYPDWHLQGIDVNADFIHIPEPGQENKLNVPVKAKENTASEIMAPKLSSNTNTIGNISANAAKPIEPLNETTLVQATEHTPAIIDHVGNAELFAAIPPLKVNCASCIYGQYDFGEVSFTLEREQQQSLIMKKFTAKRGKNNIAFDARWQLQGEKSSTSIIGSLFANNVDLEVESLGYASIIKDSGVKVDYDLVWQGGPHDFAVANFNGKLSTAFDDGYLADVDDKGVRILSFLSLQSLVRKLSFDFRDIFSDGMFYRELKGDFTVKDGVAYTDNVLMKGTAGDLTIIGNTNLNNGELDYRMSYKPNLTSSLPVLAWIATLNPVTFLAGMALDEVITSTVIAEINFEVTGNLDEPQFKQVSRKNQNISVGRSSPPKIVENATESNSNSSTAEQQNEPPPPDSNIDRS